jgi:anti-anti-sigma factor
VDVAFRCSGRIRVDRTTWLTKAIHPTDLLPVVRRSRQFGHAGCGALHVSTTALRGNGRPDRAADDSAEWEGSCVDAASELVVSKPSAENEGTVLFVLEGTLDSETAPALDALAHLGRTPVGRVVLDLAQVSTVDSSGATALVVLQHRVAEAGAHLVLRRLSSSARTALACTNLQETFTIEP